MIQVGSDSALAGSACAKNAPRAGATDAAVSAAVSAASATFPIPPPMIPQPAPAAAATRVAVVAAALQPRSEPLTELTFDRFPPSPPFRSLSHSLIQTTMKRLVMVSRDSAGPWSQSTLASMSLYTSLA